MLIKMCSQFKDEYEAQSIDFTNLQQSIRNRFVVMGIDHHSSKKQMVVWSPYVFGLLNEAKKAGQNKSLPFAQTISFRLKKQAIDFMKKNCPDVTLYTYNHKEKRPELV